MSDHPESLNIGTEGASTSNSSDSVPDNTTYSVNGIPHRARRRAQPPKNLTAEELGPGPAILVTKSGKPAIPTPEAIAAAAEDGARKTQQAHQAMDILEQRRIGPYAARNGQFAMLGAVVYTYLNGFLHLANKNRPAWNNTFKHRVFIVGPMLSMFTTSNNVIPFPFKQQIEEALGRRAITMVDILSAEKYLEAEDEALKLYSSSAAFKARHGAFAEDS